MNVAVTGSKERFNELTENTTGINWLYTENLLEHAADGYFLLDGFHESANEIEAPVFVNSVSNTLGLLKANKNIIRINGWHGFLKRKVWELCGNLSAEAMHILTALDKEYVVCKDLPGLLSARPLAMIINEAFYALGDGVSTMQEIDTAMKLGTNYPFGPFEWAQQIGEKHILELLQKLAEQDKRYIPAPELVKKCSL